MSTHFNYDGLIQKVSACCLSEEQCGTCDKENCLIGYGKECLMSCIKNKSDYILHGMDNLPVQDTRVYDVDTVVQGIGYLLNQCRNCNLYHDEECLINIIRSIFEIILFGEAQDYMGSTLVYLNSIKTKNEELANKIYKAFQSYSNKKVS